MALDASGHEVSRIDLHDGMFQPAAGFIPVFTGTFNGQPWRIANGAPAKPCVEVQSLQDRGYFCGDEGGAPLAATAFETFTTRDSANATIFARLGGDGVTATIENDKGQVVPMRVLDVPGVGRVAVGGATGNVFHVVARNAAGAVVSRVSADTQQASVEQSHEILRGTSAHGAWSVVLGVPPFVTSPLDDVMTGRRVPDTFCVGAGFGTPAAKACVGRTLYDAHLVNNGGSAATVGDPPVMLGAVPATVPRVRIHLADGSQVEAASSPLENVSGVRLWVAAVPDGASVTKIDSLDANGNVIGATQMIVPYSFLAPAP